MQIVYNKKNINLNYLNCYVKFFIDENQLFLHNTIYDKKVVLTGSNKDLKKVLTVLHTGISESKFIKVLGNITSKPKDLYEYLLQNFIVEWGVIYDKRIIKKIWYW